MQPIRFARDVTYKLLCQNDDYKILLCDFMHYNASSIILHPQQWHMHTKICQLLKVFNNATNNLSGFIILLQIYLLLRALILLVHLIIV